MIVFVNGSLSWTEGGANAFDEEGNPIAESGREEVAECFIETITQNKNGMYADGRFINCSYSVTIDQDTVPLDFNPQSIKLYHDRKGFMGEFTVQRIEYYDLTQSIELWV